MPMYFLVGLFFSGVAVGIAVAVIAYDQCWALVYRKGSEAIKLANGARQSSEVAEKYAESAKALQDEWRLANARADAQIEDLKKAQLEVHEQSVKLDSLIAEASRLAQKR